MAGVFIGVVSDGISSGWEVRQGTVEYLARREMVKYTFGVPSLAAS